MSQIAYARAFETKSASSRSSHNKGKAAQHYNAILPKDSSVVTSSDNVLGESLLGIGQTQCASESSQKACKFGRLHAQGVS